MDVRKSEPAGNGLERTAVRPQAALFAPRCAPAGLLRVASLAAIMLVSCAVPAGAQNAAAPAKGSAEKSPDSAARNRDNGPMRAIIETGVEAQKQSLASQQRIDRTVQETGELAVRYKNILKEIDGLKSYNAQLERQIENQRTAIDSLTSASGRVVEMERQIVPLMERMTQGLAEFIELDLPFRLAERRAALARLQTLLDNPDAVLSEKFRAVITAYETESAYGRSFSSYDGQLTLDGKAQSVRFLQIGRMALIFQTRDGGRSGLWNAESRKWDMLDSRYAENITRAMRVARAEGPAEELLPLPLRVPVASLPPPAESRP